MEIEFTATLSGASAITISNEGDSKVRLEVPASDVLKVIKLLSVVGQAFKVRIAPDAT